MGCVSSWLMHNKFFAQCVALHKRVDSWVAHMARQRRTLRSSARRLFTEVLNPSAEIRKWKGSLKSLGSVNYMDPKSLRVPHNLSMTDAASPSATATTWADSGLVASMKISF